MIMGHLQNLITWAKTQGVSIRGIEPSSIPGRGTGILATRKIKAEEEILTVPLRVLRRLESVSTTVREKLPADTTIQGLLAADLALDKSPYFKPWRAVLPKMKDFEAGIPMLWPRELSDLLPLESRDNLRKREREFQSNWSALRDAFPEVPYEEYTYAWMVVNTRTFYNETPETLKYPWEDRLALIPVADLFNHSDDGCKVYYSPNAYHIVADRAYKKGEELFISYSRHSNDYNLLEYGFIPDENSSDDVYIDDVVFPKLSKSHKEELKKRDLLGEYPLGSSTEEFRRTQGVLRLLCCSTKQFHEFLDAKEKGRLVQDRVDEYLVGLLEELLSDVVAKRLQQIEELKVGREDQRALLTKRWMQIEGLVRKKIEIYRLSSN
ncbi:SET domain-containing protein [Trichoderma breve]|uniref:SET domain-containing protein n=1 Tax=Trichoderma breve TaxID=2034170 RepID=A0A9W9E5S5_9HYPO|nr:SET domain-containing protein [Trichoderma breve]KAJ4859159.1 SET domain-containing protein [Trichoderma breve]